MVGMKVHVATHRTAELLEANRRHLLASTEKLGVLRTSDESGEIWTEPIDIAQEAAARGTSEALRHLLAELQQDVEHALARLESGDYGVCEDCAQPIPPERLRALPEATRCVRCQRQSDVHDVACA
jgi:DnaK suppressor protein